MDTAKLVEELKMIRDLHSDEISGLKSDFQYALDSADKSCRKVESLKETLTLERTWLKSHHKNLELAHERESVLKRKLEKAVEALEHYKQRSDSRVARMTLEDLDRRIL